MFTICFPFVWQPVDSAGVEVAVLRGDPLFDGGHQVIEVVINVVREQFFQRLIDVIVCRCLCGRIWRMRKQFPALIGDRFDDTTLNMWTHVIVVEDDMVHFAACFNFECSPKSS